MAGVWEEMKKQKTLLLVMAGVVIVVLYMQYAYEKTGSFAFNPDILFKKTTDEETGNENGGSNNGENDENEPAGRARDIEDKNGFYKTSPDFVIDLRKNYKAIIKTNYGDITVDLYEKATPVTSNNFIFLSRDGFYHGLTFHRVVKGFVIQGGDPTGSGVGGPGYSFSDEIVKRFKFKPYTLAMANSGPNTNGSQFFITTKNSSTSHLDELHTIFGVVIGGFDTVDKIENVEVNLASKPVKMVEILDVEILEESSIINILTFYWWIILIIVLILIVLGFFIYSKMSK